MLVRQSCSTAGIYTRVRGELARPNIVVNLLEMKVCWPYRSSMVVINVSMTIESDVVSFATAIVAVISANGLKEHDGQNVYCGASVHMMETAPFSLIYYISI